jgi:hypothetical protein
MSAEVKLLARLRQELRERLMSERVAGVWEVLAAFRRFAEKDPELVPEYRRWSVRFDLLATGSEETFSSAA